MLKSLIIFTLFFSLIGCTTTKNEIFLDRILGLKTKSILYNGKEYNYIDKGGISFNPWLQLPTIKYNHTLLGNKISSLIALILIDTEGKVEKVEIVKSSGFTEIDNATIEQVVNTAKSKVWTIKGKPIRFATYQRFVFYPF